MATDVGLERRLLSLVRVRIAVEAQAAMVISLDVDMAMDMDTETETDMKLARKSKGEIGLRRHKSSAKCCLSSRLCVHLNRNQRVD
jgi:hypothetical protein